MYLCVFFKVVIVRLVIVIYIINFFFTERFVVDSAREVGRRWQWFFGNIQPNFQPVSF